MVDNTLSQSKQNGLVGRGQSKQSNVQLRPSAKQSIMKQGSQKNTLRQKANSQIQQGTNSRNNLQQKAKSQIQQGTNSRNDLQQKTNSQIQQGSAESTINTKVQEIQTLNALMNIKKETTTQTPVPTSGGGNFFLNMLMGVFIVIFAILCVVGYYIWYFLTHPLDDLKGMFHL